MSNTVPNNYYNTVINNSMQENFDVPLPDYKDKDGNIDYDKFFDVSPKKDEENRPLHLIITDGPNVIDVIQTTDGDEFSPEFNSNIKEDIDEDYVIKLKDKNGKILTGTIFSIVGDSIFVENDDWENEQEMRIEINDVVEIISSGHTPDGDPFAPPTQSGGGNTVEHWDGHTTPTLNSSEQVWAEYDAYNGGGDEEDSDSDGDEPKIKLKIGDNIDIKGLKTLSNIDTNDNNENNSDNLVVVMM